MQTTHEMLESKEFRSMVSRKWVVSILLTLCLFVVYYGYILLIGMNKPFMAQKIGPRTTMGIPLGAGVIVLAWVLTALYVVWANSKHDVEVDRLKGQVKP
jgi:uncharacterized membrane protein (DUF485 family)